MQPDPPPPPPPLAIVSIVAVDLTRIRITFNQAMDTTVVPSPVKWRWDTGGANRVGNALVAPVWLNATQLQVTGMVTGTNVPTNTAEYSNAPSDIATDPPPPHTPQMLSAFTGFPLT